MFDSAACPLSNTALLFTKPRASLLEDAKPVLTKASTTLRSSETSNAGRPSRASCSKSLSVRLLWSSANRLSEIAPRGGGLVDAVHHLLHMVGDFFAVGFQIVVAVVFAGKVVEIGQKFHRRHRAGKLRADGKHQVDKRAAKRSQMLQRLRFAAKFT